MTVGEQYRAKALEFLALAQSQSTEDMRKEFENLAAAYLRLAEQADRNEGITVEFDLPDQEPKPKP